MCLLHNVNITCSLTMMAACNCIICTQVNGVQSPITALLLLAFTAEYSTKRRAPNWDQGIITSHRSGVVAVVRRALAGQWLVRTSRVTGHLSLLRQPASHHRHADHRIWPRWSHGLNATPRHRQSINANGPCVWWLAKIGQSRTVWVNAHHHHHHRHAYL